MYVVVKDFRDINTKINKMETKKCQNPDSYFSIQKKDGEVISKNPNHTKTIFRYIHKVFISGF